MNDKIRFYVEKSHERFGVDIGLAMKDSSGVVSVAQPLIMETQEKGHSIQPFMKMGLDEGDAVAQAMIDALWMAGYRPNCHDYENDQGQIKALQDHRDDLRKVAFKGLGIKG